MKLENIKPGDKFIINNNKFWIKEVEFIGIHKYAGDKSDPVGRFKNLKLAFPHDKKESISYWKESEINDFFNRKVLDFSKIP